MTVSQMVRLRDRLLATTAVVALAGACAALFAVPASAHASLVRASPADGSSVATAPSSIVLTFDENIRDPSVIVVTSPAGTRADTGGTRITDNTARTHLLAGPAGTYRVAFRVVSADGHPVSGRLSFTAGSSASGASSGPSAGDEDVTGVHAHHQSGSSPGSGWGTGRVVGTVAGLALVLGVGLLTVRHWAPSLRGDR